MPFSRCFAISHILESSNSKESNIKNCFHAMTEKNKNDLEVICQILPYGQDVFVVLLILCQKGVCHVRPVKFLRHTNVKRVKIPHLNSVIKLLRRKVINLLTEFSNFLSSQRSHPFDKHPFTEWCSIMLQSIK